MEIVGEITKREVRTMTNKNEHALVVLAVNYNTLCAVN